MKRLILALVAGLSASCALEDPVPSTPTWVRDVEPILRANCFGCHGRGDTAGNRPTGALRWDVYDKADDKWNALPMDAMGAKDNFSMLVGILARVKHKDATLKMPPAPAEPLSDRDTLVLERWQARMFPRGRRSENAKPTAEWLEEGKTFVVEDEDREQVIGQIVCGTTGMAGIPGAGLNTLPPRATPPCTVTLFDGNEEVMRTLPR